MDSRLSTPLRLTVGGAAGLAVAVGELAWHGSSELIRRRPPDVQASPADFGLPFDEAEFESTDGLLLL